MSRVPTGGGNFVSAKDITNGDTAVIKTEADWIDTQYTKEDGSKQQQYVCQVEYKGEDRRLKLTMASCEELIAFGSDSAEWIGKKIVMEKVKVMVGGSMKESILCSPFGSGADQNNPTPMTPPENPAPNTDPNHDPNVPWDE
jgi:hypothetical protein